MTKGTGPPLLNQDFFHHLNQFAIVQNLLDDMGMGLSIIFTVRKTTFPTHLFTPLRMYMKFPHSFGKKMSRHRQARSPQELNPLLLSAVKDKLKNRLADIEDLVRTADDFNQSLIPLSDGLKSR
jgi:hypothetical protein